MSKKIIKILGKRTGLGNQIQFIPIIKELQKSYIVCSDSEVFNQLGLELAPNQKADINITVFGYNYKKLWIEKRNNKGNFYGFKYRIKGKHIGFGYHKSIKFDENNHEILNNINLYNYCFNTALKDFTYKISDRKPEKRLVIAGISPKEEKTLPDKTWKAVIKEIEKLGFTVKTVDKDIGERHISTPSIADLKDNLRKASFYIGTDSGVAHLADILGIPSLIMFGSTSIRKNRPFKKESIVITRKLDCSPCFDWGRIDCKINYACMDFQTSEVLNAFKKLVKK